jgi:hypothetical protein
MELSNVNKKIAIEFQVRITLIPCSVRCFSHRLAHCLYCLLKNKSFTLCTTCSYSKSCEVVAKPVDGKFIGSGGNERKVEAIVGRRKRVNSKSEGYESRFVA